MAELQCEAKVSVEELINKTLARYFNELSEKHGVCVTRISVDWNDFSTMGQKLYIAKRISVDMKSDVQ